jgi:cytochrome d ubiquinol oxidase subunit I
MDTVLLSRIQFALAAGFHFIFPPTTFGLTFIIVILESLYLKYNDDLYKRLSSFLIKILGLVFVLGVATGIVLEFSFGTNWSQYSRLVGDIFGAPLAAEGIFSFFLESVFLGVLLFGRNRVSKKFYRLSAFLVFLGAHLSGLWILIANSWMQTPAGFRLEGGRAILTDFLQAAINHSTIIRFIHTVVAGWITGSLLVAGISAWYLLKNRHVEYAKMLLRIALIIFIPTAILQLFTGHAHSVQVARTQPEKMAAYEGLWETQTGAPLAIFGIPDARAQKTHFYIGIRPLLSFLVHFDPDAEIEGLRDFPEGERPPVFLSFVSYHIMIGLGMLFIAIALAGAYLAIRRKLGDSKWYLRVLLYSIPLPYIANEFGWIGAEVGRQPWAVYRVLKTADAASVVVPAGQILFSLLMFGVIYLLLFLVFLHLLLKFVRRGPEASSSAGY